MAARTSMLVMGVRDTSHVEQHASVRNAADDGMRSESQPLLQSSALPFNATAYDRMRAVGNAPPPTLGSVSTTSHGMPLLRSRAAACSARMRMLAAGEVNIASEESRVPRRAGSR